MISFKNHLIKSGTIIKEALKLLDELSTDAVLFVIDEQNKLIGSLTDGDVRRGLIKNITPDEQVDKIIEKEPRFLRKGQKDIEKVIEYRKKNLKIIPILNKDDQVVNVINFRHVKSYLPIDVVLMAGGKGTRLRPLTEDTPKPLLKVGDKPIIEHDMYHLSTFGIDDFWISLNYLGEQIEKHFKNSNYKNLNIEYVRENKPLGTIGAVSEIDNFRQDYVLVKNSDILTNINYEDLFLKFLEEEADFAVVTVPYEVDVPYAVLETSDGHVISYKEKPTYTYDSNGGIYLMKREITEQIPKHSRYDATDLIDSLIKNNKKIVSYSFNGYWLDIGKPDDFKKAQKDIRNLKII